MYVRYLRAWRVYLDRINAFSQRSFRDRVRAGLPLDSAERLNRMGGFMVWPMNWPEVELWFGDRDTFTLAIEAAAE
jgi:hypothetical protein